MAISRFLSIKSKPILLYCPSYVNGDRGYFFTRLEYACLNPWWDVSIHPPSPLSFVGLRTGSLVKEGGIFTNEILRIGDLYYKGQ
jgi:hypothetical protein